MSHLNKKHLPSIEEFKLQAKTLLQSGEFEKLGHAQNHLAKTYGYKDFNAIRAELKEVKPIITKLSKKIRTYRLSNGAIVNSQGLYKTKNGYKTSASASNNYINKEEVEKSLLFIDNVLEKRKTINKQGSSSYGLKHHAEDYLRHYNLFENCYIPNGAFIIALDIRRYEIQELEDNGYFSLNIQTNHKSFKGNFYDKLKNGDFDNTLHTNKSDKILNSIKSLEKLDYKDSSTISTTYFSILDNRNTKNAIFNYLSICIFHMIKAMNLQNTNKFYFKLSKNELIEEYSYVLNSEKDILKNIQQDLKLTNKILNILPNVFYDKSLDSFVIYWENSFEQQADIQKININRTFLEQNKFFHEFDESGKVKHGFIDSFQNDIVYLKYDYDDYIYERKINELDNCIFYKNEIYRQFTYKLIDEASILDKHGFFPSTKKGYIQARDFLTYNKNLSEFIIDKICACKVNTEVLDA